MRKLHRQQKSQDVMLQLILRQNQQTSISKHISEFFYLLNSIDRAPHLWTFLSTLSFHPSLSKKDVNSKVIEEMQRARDIVSTALKLRDQNKVAVRQPLQTLTVGGNKLSDEFRDIIAEEVNVKEVIFEKEAKET
jgi:isoleucyl-tRNA synthetase